ncbi:MAG: acyl carrier protein [Magnetococcales bacterium]|nr:acyl carrier protein [Magnetococcales bacterium]
MTDVSENIANQLLNVVAEILLCDLSELNMTTKMEDISQWDSIANINLILKLEELFDIEIPPASLVEMTSMPGILKVLQQSQVA